ncbi:Three prime repair exonuclease 1, partial [Halocaridina rubra]
EVNSSTQINSFVFLDLESTGLNGPSTRILELSLVAVSRNDLLSMMKNPPNPVPKLPRTLQKLTKVFNPRKRIDVPITQITGLDNFLLEHYASFSESSARSISLFLSLPKPVALVAHYGSGFDFPLLMAELKNVCDLESFGDLLVVDTLPAFRDIDTQIVKRDSEEVTFFKADGTFEDLQPPRTKAKLSGLGDKSILTRPQSSSGGNSGNRKINMSQSFDDGNFGTQEINTSQSVDDAYTGSQNANMSQSSDDGYFGSQNPIDERKDISRSLFKNIRGKPLTIATKGKTLKSKRSYEQTDIYKRLFGIEYNAHTAESDSLALLEICGHYGSDFVAWADTHASAFLSTEPMW